MKTESFKIYSIDFEKSIVTLIDANKQLKKLKTNSKLELYEIQSLKQNVKEIEITHDDEVAYFVVPKIDFKQNSFIRNFITTVEGEYRKFFYQKYTEKPNFSLLIHQEQNQKIPGHFVVTFNKIDLSAFKENIDYNDDDTQVKVYGYSTKDFDLLEKIALCCTCYEGVDILVDDKNNIVCVKDKKALIEKYCDFEFIKNNLDMYNKYCTNVELYIKLEDASFEIAKYDLKLNKHDLVKLYPNQDSNIFMSALVDESQKPGTFNKTTLQEMYCNYNDSIPLSCSKKQKVDEIIDHIKNNLTDENINEIYKMIQNPEPELNKVIDHIETNNKKLPNGSFFDNQIKM